MSSCNELSLSLRDIEVQKYWSPCLQRLTSEHIYKEKKACQRTDHLEKLPTRFCFVLPTCFSRWQNLSWKYLNFSPAGVLSSIPAGRGKAREDACVYQEKARATERENEQFRLAVRTQIWSQKFVERCSRIIFTATWALPSSLPPLARKKMQKFSKFSLCLDLFLFIFFFCVLPSFCLL